MNKFLIVPFFLFFSISCMEKNIENSSEKLNRSDRQKMTKLFAHTFDHYISSFKIYVSRLRGFPNLRFKLVIQGFETKIIEKTVKEWDNPESDRKIRTMEVLSLQRTKELARDIKKLSIGALDLINDLANTKEAIIFREDINFREKLFNLASDVIDEFINNQEKLNVSFYKERFKKWFLCHQCRKKDDSKNQVVEYENDEDITLTFEDEL